MIKKIRYNKHIKYIGVEFEGFYSQAGYDGIRLIRNTYPYFYNIGTDGSLDMMRNDNEPQYRIVPDYESYEVRTNPLTEKDLNGMFAVMDRLFKKGDYQINDSCGLHYHISFNDLTFGNLCTPEFFQAYIDMVRLNYPEVFKKRYGNMYSRGNLEMIYGKDLREHYKRQSLNRRAAINYCYQEHKTIEFRFFGSSRATIESLASCIDRTIKLIEVFNKKTTRINKRLHHEIKNEPNVIELNSESNLNKNITMNVAIDTLRSPFISKRTERIKNHAIGGIDCIDFQSFETNYAQRIELHERIQKISQEGQKITAQTDTNQLNQEEITRIIRGLTLSRE